MSKHSHYFKDVSGLQTIDVYRVLQLWNVTDPCLQHALKKILVAGGRGGGKDIARDVQEAIDTLTRWQSMQKEDADSTQPMLFSEMYKESLKRMVYPHYVEIFEEWQRRTGNASTLSDPVTYHLYLNTRRTSPTAHQPTAAPGGDTA